MHIRPHLLGIFTNAFAVLMVVQCLSISVKVFFYLEDKTVFSFTKNMDEVGDNPVQWCWKTAAAKVLFQGSR